jgi:hypothetical protein
MTPVSEFKRILRTHELASIADAGFHMPEEDFQIVLEALRMAAATLSPLNTFGNRTREYAVAAKIEQLTRALEKATNLLEVIADDAKIKDDTATWAMASVMARDCRATMMGRNSSREFG